MKGLKIIKLSIVLTLFSSCYYDIEEELYQPVECNTMDMSYTNDILPIISSTCYTCHSSQLNLGSVTLEGYNNFMVYVENGRLVGAINHDAGFSPMPQGQAQLTDCKISKIEAWIAQGATNN